MYKFFYIYGKLAEFSKNIYIKEKEHSPGEKKSFPFE
jgi:hypothetical protein